jgi:hypothetical protein
VSRQYRWGRQSAYLLAFILLVSPAWSATPRRLVILKVDGLGEDLLASALEERDPASGKSQLPWLSHIFAEQGAIYENFYTRGISLSAPSWSMLDTGRHTIIRGNVEYDRFTGEVYDYLNFFPLYIGYARQKQVDSPGVEVLDRAGIPLLIDHFEFPQIFQSFQLFQRGVRWTTLQDVLKRKFSSKSIFSMLEGATPSYDSLLQTQTKAELVENLQQPQVLYLDFFTGDVDHIGHASSEPAALLKELRKLDTLAGQLWTAIQHSPLADQTLFVMVSDHGMNNVPRIVSQTYNLTDLLNSPAGGAHHVVTNREQLSDFKFRSLYPLLHRVVNPSESSFYLRGEAEHYPTAWLDIDGNERAALHLRNSDLNKIHVLLQQLARPELEPGLRKAAAQAVNETIDKHRSQWSSTAQQLDEELQALKEAIKARRTVVGEEPRKFNDLGEKRKAWRLRQELEDWQMEYEAYSAYLKHLQKLLTFEPGPLKIFTGKIADLIPEMSVGDLNTQEQIRHYVAGPGPDGLQMSADGRLDEERSFRYVDYPKLFCEQRGLNRPQPELPEKPVDFTAMRIADTSSGEHVYWLYGGEQSQLEILTDSTGRIALRPLNGGWRNGLPLALVEDPDLRIPAGVQRLEWLSEWHSEQEWFAAIHKTRYSNGVIGVTEELSPVGENVPGRPGMAATLLRYERRRRELVQADIHLFAADHWNFNVRFPNPGGNHGSFLRISTHSVWMMAGAGVAPGRREEPVDSLAFERELIRLMQIPERR